MRSYASAVLLTMSTLTTAAHAGPYSPIECNKAASPAERTICDSYILGQKEARMATLFSIATSLVAMGQRGDIQDGQRQWLAARDACGRNIGCLNDAYDRRIRALDGVIAGVASRGPY